MSIVNNVRIVKLSSQNLSSQDELEYFMCRKPLGNIQLYFDDQLLLDITNQDHPDYDEDNTKLMSSFTTSVKEYFFYSTDSGSQAAFDALLTSHPETSIRIYFDDELILEHIKK